MEFMRKLREGNTEARGRGGAAGELTWIGQSDTQMTRHANLPRERRDHGSPVGKLGRVVG